MKKAFIILVGDNNAKNILQEKLKKKYWVWNANPLNHLRHNAGALGWEFSSDSQADNFIQKLLDLSNTYLDYEYQYVLKFVEKIKESNKAKENGKEADVLIVHVNRDLSERLQDEFQFFLLSADMKKEQVEDNFQNGKFVISLNDSEENIDKAIENIMNLILV